VPLDDAIVCDRLTKDYGSARALDGLSLRVHRGEVFGYLGSNGAGKTTTIRCFLDLLRPTAGIATLLGLDSRRDSIALRRRTGYLPGDLRLYPRLTARQSFSPLPRTNAATSASELRCAGSSSGRPVMTSRTGATQRAGARSQDSGSNEYGRRSHSGSDGRSDRHRGQAA
jgi:ABC-type Fe3+/spermidine/putrescine transport system ATPase subunit